ncbi:hypothetical protein MHTCC0001_09550 [Flavobacteriaceae bacterium MHTCC 0001]
MKSIQRHQINRQLKKLIHLKKDNLEDSDISLEILIQCRSITAKIIRENGDAFLPIFIRIEKEIEEEKKRNNYKDIALQIAENER